MQTHFKVVRALLGSKRIISTRLGVGSLQMVSEPIPDLGVGFVWSCKGICFTPQSHGTQRVRCICMGVFVTSHIGQEGKFLMLYKYELLLTLQMHFKTMSIFQNRESFLRFYFLFCGGPHKRMKKRPMNVPIFIKTLFSLLILYSVISFHTLCFSISIKLDEWKY